MGYELSLFPGADSPKQMKLNEYSNAYIVCACNQIITKLRIARWDDSSISG